MILWGFERIYVEVHSNEHHEIKATFQHITLIMSLQAQTACFQKYNLKFVT